MRRRLSDLMALSLLAGRIRWEVDPTLGDLIDRVALGDDTALAPAVDRLLDLGRSADAARLRAACERKT